MRKIIGMLLCTAIVTISAFAQEISEDKVPASVMSAFKTKFPKVEKAEWEMEDGNYEAEFKLNDVEQSIIFSADGKWIATETDIKVSELPESVRQSLAKEFAGFKVDEATKKLDAQSVITYEAEIEKGKEEYEVLVSADGKVLSKTKEEEKDEKKE